MGVCVGGGGGRRTLLLMMLIVAMMTIMMVLMVYMMVVYGDNNNNNNNNNNVHLSCPHQRRERSHDNIHLNMIFYTHAEHRPTKTIYIELYQC